MTINRKIYLITKKAIDGLAPAFNFKVGAAMPFYDPLAGKWKVPVIPKGDTARNRSLNSKYANFYRGASRTGVHIVWTEVTDEPPTTSELNMPNILSRLPFYQYPTILDGDPVDEYLAGAPFWVTVSINEISEIILP